jgi:hypothetical protein
MNAPPLPLAFAVLAAAALSLAAAAQVPTVTILAATPVGVHAATAGASRVETLPAGAVGANRLRVEALGIAAGDRAEASTFWGGARHETELRFDWNHQLTVEGASVGSARTDLADIVVEIDSPTAIEVDLTISAASSLAAGMVVPVARADVGDDGSFEFDESTAGARRLRVQIGTSPLRVRLRTQIELSGPGQASLWLSLAAKPVNSLVITSFELGCTTGTPFLIRPSFVDRGVLCQAGFPPVFAVFGFSQQPRFLAGTLSPNCLLVPSLDVVVALSALGSFSIPLPAAARPITFWAQAVVFDPVIGTANGFVCTAY